MSNYLILEWQKKIRRTKNLIITIHKVYRGGHFDYFGYTSVKFEKTKKKLNKAIYKFSIILRLTKKYFCKARICSLNSWWMFYTIIYEFS